MLIKLRTRRWCMHCRVRFIFTSHGPILRVLNGICPDILIMKAELKNDRKNKNQTPSKTSVQKEIFYVIWIKWNKNYEICVSVVWALIGWELRAATKYPHFHRVSTSLDVIFTSELYAFILYVNLLLLSLIRGELYSFHVVFERNFIHFTFPM